MATKFCETNCYLRLRAIKSITPKIKSIVSARDLSVTDSSCSLDLYVNLLVYVYNNNNNNNMLAYKAPVCQKTSEASGSCRLNILSALRRDLI